NVREPMVGICWNPRSVLAENAICRTCPHLTSPPEVANEKQRRWKEIQTRLLLPLPLPRELSIITTRLQGHSDISVTRNCANRSTTSLECPLMLARNLPFRTVMLY